MAHRVPTRAPETDYPGDSAWGQPRKMETAIKIFESNLGTIRLSVGFDA